MCRMMRNVYYDTIFFKDTMPINFEVSLFHKVRFEKLREKSESKKN